MVNINFQRSGVPIWFARAMDSVQAAFNAGPRLLDPVSSVDINTVYPAGSYKGYQALATDIDRVAVSNGTNWLRTDTGAIL